MLASRQSATENILSQGAGPRVTGRKVYRANENSCPRALKYRSTIKSFIESSPIGFISVHLCPNEENVSTRSAPLIPHAG